MRMWNINPKFLCTQHLLGEHVECHMFVGCLLKGKKIDGYIKNGLLEIHNLKSRHDELVKEMTDRGMKHKSDLQPFNEETCGKVKCKLNVKHLFNKCKKCRKRIIKYWEE